MDHSGFPHLMSMILDHSDLGVLSTFRQTSRDFAASREISTLAISHVFRRLWLLDSPEGGQAWAPTIPLPNRELDELNDVPIDSTSPLNLYLLEHIIILGISAPNYSPVESLPLPNLHFLEVMEVGNGTVPLPSCHTTVIHAPQPQVYLNPSRLERLIFVAQEFVSDDDLAGGMLWGGLDHTFWSEAGSVEEVVILATTTGWMDPELASTLAEMLAYFLFRPVTEGTEDRVSVQRVHFVGVAAEMFALGFGHFYRINLDSWSLAETEIMNNLEWSYSTHDEYAESLGEEERDLIFNNL